MTRDEMWCENCRHFTALAALRELQAAQHHARRAQDDAEERMATDAADQAFVTGQAYRAAIDILAKHFGLETPPITGTVQETHL